MGGPVGPLTAPRVDCWYNMAIGGTSRPVRDGYSISRSLARRKDPKDYGIMPAPGLNGVLETALPGGYTIVMLSNYDPPAAEAVSEKIRDWMGLHDD